MYTSWNCQCLSFTKWCIRVWVINLKWSSKEILKGSQEHINYDRLDLYQIKGNKSIFKIIKLNYLEQDVAPVLWSHEVWLFLKAQWWIHISQRQCCWQSDLTNPAQYTRRKRLQLTISQKCMQIIKASCSIRNIFQDMFEISTLNIMALAMIVRVVNIT